MDLLYLVLVIIITQNKWSGFLSAALAHAIAAGPFYYIIFHLKGHAVKLKCVNCKIFWNNMIFAKKTPF